MSNLTTIQSTDLITNSRTDINNNFSLLNSEKLETSVLDTDTTLSANSDAKIPSQKAVKAFVENTVTVDASEVVKGAVEEATDTEVLEGTATGGTGAKLVITPTKLSSYFSGFGDGSDGALSISSGTTTLTSDKQYTSVSVTGTAILETAGYKIYCQGTVTVDATSGACIRNNGGNGGNGSGITGGTAGSAPAGITVPAGVAGQIGGGGRNTAGNGNVGAAGTNKTLSIGVAGAAGGVGGDGNGRAGGTAGAAGTLTQSSNKVSTIGEASLLIDTTNGTITFATGDSGSGSGGGGACDNTSGGGYGGAGGGSGASGGCVFIATQKISLTGSGAIQAKGGTGGNGADASQGNNGGGGGGGGGAGGQVIIICRNKSGAGTIDVSGGAGGAGGLKISGAGSTDGASGTAGTSGRTLIIH